MSEKTEGAIKNGKFKDTSNIGHKTQNEAKQNKNHNTQHLKDEKHWGTPPGARDS